MEHAGHRARPPSAGAGCNDRGKRPGHSAAACGRRTGAILQDDDVGIRRLTPALGEDEDYVFGELLGLSSAQRADLERREVIL